MEIYQKINWPEIQDYMDNGIYPSDCYYDSTNNVWFIPDWYPTNEDYQNYIMEKFMENEVI